MSKRQEQERESQTGRNGNFSFLIFNARSSIIPPSLSLSSQTAANRRQCFPHFSASHSRRKYSLDFDTPTFLSIEPRKISALFNCSSPHPPPTLPSHMSFPQGHPDDAIPRSQHVTAYRREIPANEATGRLLNLSSLYSPVIS